MWDRVCNGSWREDVPWLATQMRPKADGGGDGNARDERRRLPILGGERPTGDLSVEDANNVGANPRHGQKELKNALVGDC